MAANDDTAEKINELLGAVAALKAYVAHLPGAAEADLDAIKRAGRDTGSGLIGWRCDAESGSHSTPSAFGRASRETGR
jgi:hypothetical protein